MTHRFVNGHESSPRVQDGLGWTVQTVHGRPRRRPFEVHVSTCRGLGPHTRAPLMIHIDGTMWSIKSRRPFFQENFFHCDTSSEKREITADQALRGPLSCGARGGLPFHTRFL